MGSDSKKDKKDKKSKKSHKSDKKHKKGSKRKDSDSDNSPIEDEWVEKPVLAEAQEASVEPAAPAPTKPETLRASWMTEASGNPGGSEDPLAVFGLRAAPRSHDAKHAAANAEKDRKDAIRKDREINKSYFDNPNQPPDASNTQQAPLKPAAAIVFGDAKSNWRMMRLRRLLESAEEEERELKDLALERWGSLDELNQLLEERAFLDNKQGKKTASSSSASTGRLDRVTEKYKSSSDFKRPRVGDERVDEFGREKRSSSSRGGGGDRALGAKDASVRPTSSAAAAASRSLPSAATGGIVRGGGGSSSASNDGPVLTMDELNKMNARILRNGLMGTEDPELVAKYNREKERYEHAVASGEGAGSKNETVIVPTIDSRGRLQDIGSGVDAHKVLPGNAKRKREDLKATHDESGQRIHYPGESETGSTIQDLLLQEKMGSGAGYDQEMANRISRDVTYREDLDYMDEKADDLAKKTQVSDYSKRQNAIHDFKKSNAALEKCIHCFQDSTNAPKTPLLATGSRMYLTLPSTIPLTPYHCQIVPIAHTLTTLELDDDDWTELRNFMKCVIQMNWERGFGTVFMEQVVNFKWHKHTVVDCVAVPLGKFEDAPAYFKEAIEASEEEWSQHRKLIDTSKNGFRRSMVKNLPYFHVWFEPNKGYGHVIEDSQEWPDWFGREVLASMMELSPDKWRRPKRASGEEIGQRVGEFRKAFDKFDWTKALGEKDKREVGQGTDATQISFRILMTMDPNVGQLLALLASRNETLSTAESITSGLVAAALTDVAGASRVFRGGIVAYSDTAKHNLLGVPREILAPPGPSAVSAECAALMAVGALRALETDWAVSTTGYAGGRLSDESGEGESNDAGFLRDSAIRVDDDDGLVYIHVCGPGGTACKGECNQSIE
ncbi:hypothetical protein HDU98_006112 [Podochytrium sp. JEL0797]|nr:hypothetical protein HDU98_006112 [Podochytrium sp. JEL0797]